MTTEKKPKQHNSRYKVVSKAREVFDKFYAEQGYDRYSDMYEEIAEYCGISPSTVSQLRLKGDRGLLPSYIVGIKIAEFIGVQPTDMWSIEEIEGYQGREKCIVDGCERIGTAKGLCMRHVYLTTELNEGKSLDKYNFREK